MLTIGAPAPDFSATTNTGETVSLASLRGKNIVLYFYPKDDTPGCTKEACSFRDNLPHFSGINAVILGVSRDDAASHAKFVKKFDLNFPLLVDESGAITEAYGVWVEKSMYGKKYMGIERSTFLIDADGKLAAIWSKVKVDGHTEEVLAAAQNLTKKAA
ncbi:MAG: thioredoxin-dependent thiol peroxidase [Alphaproteobacteria bacterium]|jgi:peroxiredoxin Q/BCP|nr:thioredoxin-dependent thiol peroxidase [Thalassospira sp.]MCE2965800.1 thioredoxin-dependent thiol peroxidase [Alphaproteobacteria bacterium]